MRPVAKIYYSSLFGRAFKKLPIKFLSEVKKRENMFRKDCFDFRLKTHKLKGRHKAFWSFSITRKHRVMFRFISSDAVLFIDVGDHSIYQ